MIYCFYTIVSVKGNSVIVSEPYSQNYSMSVLCDKARSLSLEYLDTFVSIYKHFIQVPRSTKLLYRFIDGKLVKYE